MAKLLDQKTFEKDVLVWDTKTWSKALVYWGKIARQQGFDKNQKKGLELGANYGGMSLFFSHRFQSSMVCSDLQNPAPKAEPIHLKYAVSSNIRYEAINACTIPYPDSHFDFVVFRSLLGVIGANVHVSDIQLAFSDIQRVLKPGGLLFYAENMKASQLHQFARRRFVAWGRKWHYLSSQELNVYLSAFKIHEMQRVGFLTAFFSKSTFMQRIAVHIDNLCFFVPDSWKYVAFGYAQK